MNKRPSTQTRCRESVSCRLGKRGRALDERQGRARREKKRVDTRKDVEMYTRMQPSILEIRKKANRNRFYHRLQDRNQVIRQWKGWRRRGWGCRCNQQGVRYDHKFRRTSGTWRWSVNWRGSRWTCPPRCGNVVHEVRASEKCFG